VIANLRDPQGDKWLELPPSDTEVPEEWRETCRNLAYRFYGHAINRRFEQLPGVADLASREWNDLTGAIDSASIGDKPLAELGLKVRLLNLLERAGIITLQQLEDVDESVLYGLGGVSNTTIDTLVEFCVRVRQRGDEGKR